MQTNKIGEFAGHVQIKQVTNSLTSVQHSKWARSTNSQHPTTLDRPKFLIKKCWYTIDKALCKQQDPARVLSKIFCWGGGSRS